MPKDNLRDKLEGNELDLSLNNLTTVPVKELAALPKATHLDLSCNSIVTLPENFCTLTYLVKIDLSKNELTELPDRIGALHNLQHLDLLGNKLCMLPVSFYQLRKLKWLDLKDNPLTDDLKKVAGDCLDEMQCKKCAQKVIEYMKKINSELERIRQKKLQEEREKEEAIKAAEEATIREKREQRKAEKERKKKEKQESAKRERQNSKGDTAKIISQPEANGKIDNKKISTQDHKRSSIWSLLIALLVASIAVVVGVYVFCDSYADQRMCIQYWKPFLNETSQRYTQIHRQGAVLIERLVNMTKS